MTDIQKAMLGDKEAAERLTERGELLPCPVCGKEAEVNFYAGDGCIYPFSVYCKKFNCVVIHQEFRTKKAAIKYWNTRPQLLTKEQIEALERMEEE